jgi:mannose-6-phosphate isomerase-like protein (cupin superfamily)
LAANSGVLLHDLKEMKIIFTILSKNELERSGHTNTPRFEGYRYGDTNLSFYWVDLPPGGGPRLHRHPCEEIFIIQEGRGTFTVGATILEATAGQIVIVPPNTPYKFINAGEGPLRQIAIQPSKQIITEWLED